MLWNSGPEISGAPQSLILCDQRQSSGAWCVLRGNGLDTPAMTKTQALVLFSGGQDSTVCLAWALSRFDQVETIGFDYGQRHAQELMARPVIRDAIAGFAQWTGKLGEDHLIALNAPRAIGGSALTESMAIAMGENGLPNTF